MISPPIAKIREFLSSWKNIVALGSLPLLGAWIYSRVWMVKPAILGDEYLYSMNARKVGPWILPWLGTFRITSLTLFTKVQIFVAQIFIRAASSSTSSGSWDLFC